RDRGGGADEARIACSEAAGEAAQFRLLLWRWCHRSASLASPCSSRKRPPTLVNGNCPIEIIPAKQPPGPRVKKGFDRLSGIVLTTAKRPASLEPAPARIAGHADVAWGPSGG